MANTVQHVVTKKYSKKANTACWNEEIQELIQVVNKEVQRIMQIDVTKNYKGCYKLLLQRISSANTGC